MISVARLLVVGWCVLLPAVAAAQAAPTAVPPAAESASAAASSASSAASSAAAAKKSAEDAEAAKFALTTTISKGDRIRLRSNVINLKPVNGATGTRLLVATCLRVISIGSDGKVTASVEEGSSITSGKCLDLDVARKTRDSKVEEGDVYEIGADQLQKTSYSRYGWIHGPMVVPFKFFPHDRSFEPSQSLGMYMGYRTSWFESRGLSFVASAGLATMKVSTVADDPDKPGNKITKENTVAGYSIAGGVLFDLTNETKPFVAGLMMGWDFVGSNSALTYRHDKRNWFALQIGWVL